MFGGIIDAIGEVRVCRPTAGGARLTIRAPGYWTDVRPGASIAIDGVCLTVTGTSGPEAGFDVVAETLRRSTLGGLRPGDGVNLQKSLAVGERIDGHFVQGHVDAIGVVERVDASEAECKYWFRVDPAALAYLVPKGSVAIDGISLTIADLHDGLFSVALIPTTLQRTTIGRKKPGNRVNIETDILVRTVVNHIQSIGQKASSAAEAVTMDLLWEQGFA